MSEAKESGGAHDEIWTPGMLLTTDVWINTWSKGQSKEFHLPHVCGLLKKHLDTLLAGRKHVKILFPFCGKDVSMKWLAELGHSIVGIECAKQACLEFFEESKLSYSTESVGSFTLYKSEDGLIKLYCGDLYDFSPELERDFGAVWDRGGLNAVNAVERTKYVDLMLSMMAPDCVYLLTNFDSDDPKIAEEWECLTDEKIMELFGDRCDVALRVEYVDAAFYNEGLNMEDMEGLTEKLSVITLKK